MTKNMLLRDALGVDADFAFSEDEIADLRQANMGITPYCILFTARSGSTFLTHEVSSARVLSTPNEWLSWEFVSEDIKNHGGTPVDFVKRLIKSQKSEQGVFGLETNRLMLELFEDLLPLHKLFLRRPRWFFLRRRNLVMQAISNYLADMSQVFHSYQRNDERDKKIESVEYDAGKIRSYVQNFIIEETWCIQRLANMNVAPVPLYYEDITTDPRLGVKTIANVLGIYLQKDYIDGNVENPIKRMANEKNRIFEDRFRAEEQDFLNEMLEKRPQVLAPVKSI